MVAATNSKMLVIGWYYVNFFFVFTKFNNLMTILFNNSSGLSYFTFKCSKRKMTGSFRLARCFGSTFVTMTVTTIEFKLLLFGVKREKRMFIITLYLECWVFLPDYSKYSKLVYIAGYLLCTALNHTVTTLGYCLLGKQGVGAQWWNAHLPPVWPGFDSGSVTYVGWVCCRLSPCSEGFFNEFGFLPST